MGHTRLERLFLRVGLAIMLAAGLGYGWWRYVDNRRISRNVELFSAVGAGDARRVESLLSAGADPNCDAPVREGMSFRGELARGLVDRAILEGNSDVAVALLRHGGRLNLGRMMEIAALPETRVLEYEIANKGQPRELFRYACMAGNDIQAKYVVARFPELRLSLKGDDLANIRLSQAAKKGSINTVKTLLQNGADPNFKGIEYMTPIMHAAKNGKQDVVALLLAAGVDVKYKDFRGETALTYARKSGNPRVVELLYGPNR